MRGARHAGDQREEDGDAQEVRWRNGDPGCNAPTLNAVLSSSRGIGTASPCRLDETVISSLFINLVSCHQNYRCVSLLIVYVTSTETGLTRFDLPAQSLTILLFHDPSVTRALIAVGIRN
jgi:hypothetical protein